MCQNRENALKLFLPESWAKMPSSFIFAILSTAQVEKNLNSFCNNPKNS